MVMVKNFNFALRMESFARGHPRSKGGKNAAPKVAFFLLLLEVIALFRIARGNWSPGKGLRACSRYVEGMKNGIMKYESWKVGKITGFVQLADAKGAHKGYL